MGWRIALTDASTGFLPQAHAFLTRVAAAQEVLADLPDLERERLAVCTSQTIASSWLGPLLARFHRLYPKRVLDVAVGNARQVAQAMPKREARLGFVEGKVGEPLPARAAIPGDRLVLVAPADHPRRVAFAALPVLAVLLREAGSGTRQMFESAARVAGIAPEYLRVVLELPSNEAVLSALAAGAGGP